MTLHGSKRALLAAGLLTALSTAAMAQVQPGEGKQNVPGGMENRPGGAGPSDAARSPGTRSMTLPPAARSAPPAPGNVPAQAPAPAAKDDTKDKPKQ